MSWRRHLPSVLASTWHSHLAPGRNWTSPCCPSPFQGGPRQPGTLPTGLPGSRQWVNPLLSPAPSRAPCRGPPCANSLRWPGRPRRLQAAIGRRREDFAAAAVTSHMAIPLPSALAPGPGSTTTWQGPRERLAKMDVCPSALPARPGHWPLLCQPRDCGSQPPAAARPACQDAEQQFLASPGPGRASWPRSGEPRSLLSPALPRLPGGQGAGGGLGCSHPLPPACLSPSS